MLVCVTMLPVVAIIIFSNIKYREHLIDDARREIILMTSSMAEVQNDLANSVRQTLTVLSLLPEVQSFEGTKASVIFKSIVWQNQEYHNISLVALDGAIVASAKPFTSDINLSDRKHVQEAIEHRDFSVGEFILGRAGGNTPVFSYAYPVFDEDLEMISILTATITLDYFTNFHEFADMPPNAIIAVTDHQGIRLFYYPPNQESNPIGRPIKASTWNRVQELSPEEARGSFFAKGSDGVKRIFTFEKIRISEKSSPYMYVWAGTPEQHIFKIARKALLRNMILLFLSIVLALLIFLLVAKNIIIEPVNRLVELTQKFAAGELPPCPEQSSGPKELRVLHNAFFDMATERKQIEEERVRSEAKFRAVIDQASDSIYMISELGNIRLVNKSACELMGYTEEQFLRLKVQDIDPLFNKRQDIQKIWEPLEEGGTTIIETSHQSKDGRVFPVEVHFGGITVENKKAYLGIVRDISARKELEASLKQSKEEWENTFNAMSDIITIQNRDMKIIRANRAFYDTFPGERKQVQSSHCYQLFHSDGQICEDCPGQRTLGDGKTHHEEITDEPTGKTFSVVTCPILDDDGNFEHLVHIVKDITESKKLEEELFQAHKMEAIGTLAGGIAHDFNNILSAIMGFAEFIKDDVAEDSQTSKDAEEILSATHRAKELVKQILTFSRKNDGNKSLIEPQLVVQEAVNMLRSTFPASVMILEDIQKDCCAIMANSTNIHQVVLNLCTNARYAMIDDKGILRVELKEVTRRLNSAEDKPYDMTNVALKVIDNGSGIHPDDLERIFEPYYTTREVGSGSGLGLSVTHGIVEDCKGTIEIDSEVGKGTTVSVYFPCHEGEVETKRTGDNHKKELGKQSGGRILMVDDEPLLLKINARRLEGYGYSIVTTESGAQALKFIYDDPNGFDLLITDQTMPDLTGQDLAQEVLQVNESMPIIICTGHSQSFTEEMALAMGIKKYVLKPLLGDELLDAVNEVLQRAL